MVRDKTKNVVRPFRELYRRMQNASRKNRNHELLIWILGALVIGLLFIGPCLDCVYGAEKKDPSRTIAAYVDYFHRHMQPLYARKAKRLIQPLIQYSKKYDIDPLLMACLFSFESSWRNFEGTLGEIGPGHIMPSKWSKQFDLTTLEGQIESACARMRKSFDDCRTLKGALTHYACGNCISKSERTKSKINYRIDYYQRMKRKFYGKKS